MDKPLTGFAAELAELTAARPAHILLRYCHRAAAEIHRLQSLPAGEAPQQTTGEPLYIIFDGPPSHESGRFVEVETAAGRSVNAGQWEEYPGNPDLWRLGPFVLASTPAAAVPALAQPGMLVIERDAADWSLDRMQHYLDCVDCDCTCEPCPQCGKMPAECTGTPCAQTCQCCECDHCQTLAARDLLKAALSAAPEEQPK